TAIFLALAATAAAAQSYPTRAVRVLVGFPPGGGTDIMARLLSPKLSEYLGQQYVVENRPGATTNIASAMVATAAPDGYTLLFTTSALAINMSLYKNLTFDAIRDFAPISVFADSPNLLVAHSSAGASEARRDELFVGGLGHLAAPRRRALQGAHRRADRAHPLQRHRRVAHGG